MTTETPLWGEDCIANELLLELSIHISLRTVRKYMPRRPPHRPRTYLRWATFPRRDAQGILGCDFCVAITANFRMLYVFVVIGHETHRLVHYSVTTHRTAPWTLQQLIAVTRLDHRYRFLLRDRDSISLPGAVNRFGVCGSSYSIPPLAVQR